MQFYTNIGATKEGDFMLKYKIDVLFELKSKGYNTNKIRKEKLLGESALQYIRQGKPVGPVPLDTLCRLLECQPGDLLEWVADEGGEK